VVIKFSAATLQLPRLRIGEHMAPLLSPINDPRWLEPLTTS
jgi:hypothetical protein